MILSEKAIANLQSKGINILGENSLSIYKAIGKPGNSIPNWKSFPIVEIEEDGTVTNEIYSDCPILVLDKKGDKFSLIHWDWIPGPGPGDFELEFESETAVLAFIQSYFFEENEYFEARKNYEQLSRDTINTMEIKSIFEVSLTTFQQAFDETEIAFQRYPFHKLPLEKFRTKSFESEQPMVQVELGFLSNQIRALRTKIFEKESFDADDIRNVADLLMELSVLMKIEEDKT